MVSRRSYYPLSLLVVVIATIGIPVFSLPSFLLVPKHDPTDSGSISYTAGDIRAYSYSGTFEVTLHSIFDGAGDGRAVGRTAINDNAPASVLASAHTIDDSIRHSPLEKGSDAQRTSISGTLLLKVFSTSAQGAAVGVQLVDAACPSEITVNPRCTEVYQSPFLAVIANDGEIRFEKFSHQLSLSEERKLKGLFESLSLNLKVGERWDEQGSDGQGTAVYRYQRNATAPGRLLRNKLDYLAVSSGQNLFDRGEVISSHGEFTVASKGSWLDSAEVSETTRFSQDNTPRLEYAHRVILSHLKDRTLSPSWLPLSLKEFKEFLSAGEKRLTSRSEEERAKRAAVLLKGDPKGLQKRLSLVGASQSPSEILQSTEALKIWLEANPASIRTIPQTLLRTDLNDDVRSRIVYALQKVGGEKAEQALLEIAESGAHTDSTRRAAIGAFNFVRISPQTEQELWKMRAGERFSGDSEEARAVYREMATLALGGGARALLDESPERGAAIVAKLSSELEGATQRRAVRDIETLIMALGNSSHEEATPLLIQYLDSTVDSVRGAVVTALQSSERELPLDTIIEKALNEENPNVRTQFIELLSKEPITPYSFASAMQLFVEEDDRSARLALAKYLARAGNEYPEQRHHIKLLFRSERDPLVAKALGTR